MSGIYRKIIFGLQHLTNRQALLLTLCVAFVYELLLSFQGFNLTDEGATLATSQQIFRNPSSVEYQFVYYLGAFAGGIWNFLFGFGGIFSFRILSTITLTTTIFFTCLSVKQYIKPVVIPVASALILLSYNFGIMVFHHNYLTALLISVSLYFILEGFRSGKPRMIFWGALFTGINVFTRIPNLSMLALGLLIFVDYAYERDNKKLADNIKKSLLGFFSGLSVILLLVYFCGHWDIFSQSISTLFSAATNAESTHEFSFLLAIYVSNGIHICIYLGIIAFSFISLAYVYDFFRNKYIRILSVIAYAGIMMFVILRAFDTEKYYALILFPILISCWVDRKEKSIILLNTASLIVMFFLPLGSDYGVRNMGAYSIWPATFTAVWHACRFIGQQKQKEKKSILVFSLTFFSLYVVYQLYFVSNYAYYDRGPRWEKHYKAKNPRFTVYTTKERAYAMDELLAALNNFVQEDDYLFCFESLPMVHYLTGTRPYLGNPWPWTYDPDSFKKHLDQSVASIPLPPVLKQKCQPLDGYGNWIVPDSGEIYMNPWFYKQERVDYFEEFIRENRYQIAWENKLFIIYTIQ